MAKIHSISISNFRGINKFEQTFGQKNFICLIGRGDSGKTTILEAINLVLSSNWNVTFTDNDFHNQNIQEPIEIIATLYDLPEAIIKETKFGLYLRGIDTATGLINDEIQQNDVAAITIKLSVDDSLEPLWYVINSRLQSDIEIKSSDRNKFNAFLVSDYIDKHFSWSKGSPLYSLLKTDDSAINATALILETIREAKNKIDSSAFPDLQGIVENIKTNAQKFGVDLSKVNTTIDFKDIIIKEGKINLHDKNTPVRLKGKGSKRLLSIAIQLELFSLNHGGILLIDEIEQGLESDRVQNLARILKSNDNAQIFITTHSRDVIVELNAEDLFKVSKNSDKLYSFAGSEQGTLRSSPEAFFAKKIILCEGATEVGIVRGINNFNYSAGDFRFSHNGVRYLDCNGDSKIQRFIEVFKDKEYEILVFCDSDNDGNPAIQTLKKIIKDNNIDSVQCESGKAIEHQIFSDLNFDSVKKIFDLDLLEDKTSLADTIKARFTGTWLDDYLLNDNPQIRTAIGIASNKKGWFKRIDLGTLVGEICMTSLVEFEGKYLHTMLTDLNNWAAK
ncbi:DNA replication and repair protein RecF [Flavobacterium bizetiae]|uniref:DNA replication and repair protein RecF n=1 Tax=Flavobacterium bizetiae TaxID=2704140 RepID=A0A6J4GUJ5_9FLAO|nr:ATP-binding protein [Flavobacterium bizetiae]CAA9202940.1 DNA replication and repair protein RecF [Flavobacterium bizetiae]CAD5343587.1 DNA replication and repair protein RecF [Flavobacterium bizetiae]CAD5349582.1 DNA replication and repair protein RecF [Flavobacterium bizetiae]